MKIRALLIALLLLPPLLPAYAATPPKAGAICSKAGITKNYNGKKYTCIKSGKKYVWNRGVNIKSPTPNPAQTTPTPTPSPTPTPTPTPSPTPTPTPTPTPSPSPSPTARSVRDLALQQIQIDGSQMNKIRGHYISKFSLIYLNLYLSQL